MVWKYSGNIYAVPLCRTKQSLDSIYRYNIIFTTWKKTLYFLSLKTKQQQQKKPLHSSAKTNLQDAVSFSQNVSLLWRAVVLCGYVVCMCVLWIVIIVIIDFWWIFFLEEYRSFFCSLTSVLLLALGCWPQASNKGWFMQMDKEEMQSLFSLSFSFYLAWQPH